MGTGTRDGLELNWHCVFHTNVVKGLKIKVRKFSGLIHTFVEITSEKLVGEPLCLPTILLSWIGWKKRFDNINKSFKDDNAYPYEQMDDWEKLTEMSVPEKDDF